MAGRVMYGAGYGIDSAALSTSSQPDEAACCQACYTSAPCLYWDYVRSTGTCRLKGDQGPTLPPGQSIPGFYRDTDRVAGAKRGASAYANTNVMFSADPNAITIWSHPYAFVVSLMSQDKLDWYTYFYRSFYTSEAITGATFRLNAAPAGTLYLNGRQLLPGNSYLKTASISISLAAGINLLVIRTYKGPNDGIKLSWASGTLVAPNNTVLMRTDESWLWMTFASSTADKDIKSNGPQFATDGIISDTGLNIFRSGSGDPSPWLSIDLAGLYNVNRIVLYSRQDCCKELLANAEIRVGGALVSNFLTSAQIPLNQLVYRVMGPSTSGSVLNIELYPPVTGRYITLQSFGINNATVPSLLQMAEVQAYGELAGLVRTTDLGSSPASALLLRGGASSRGLELHATGTALTAGVSTYVYHPRLTIGAIPPDPEVVWISSQPTAFVPIMNQLMASTWQSTTFYRSFQLTADQLQRQLGQLGQAATSTNATLTVFADDLATVLVNGREIGRTTSFPSRNVFQVSELRAGHNLIVLRCDGLRGPAVVLASLAGPDGALLLHTDHTWNWL
ncbi:hypothetical protein VOLCADRAFT_92832 [Volvox carteri f. nagariensis]|uniref:Fucolectin tachylectin-4 pentraxin-1 domain-containing protein n=1 Tax=Volvox carteri f. nagariensis TaxID=3068 RepID=D8U0K8_VOLCA|nr:uncharacterized protein VOLCADRAFT_92832 [Volvox carteri f. nagariensis]EFJ46737.1 hypothetical protein VOLCADRAFT_92832 [Volvox carteri f. nagariensis]|eukprot:XP_002952266.1 hypothetical protein VOLCADRAFT_92832 [Volvox carteri f. nagariensis]